MIQIKNNIKIFISVFISLFLIFFISSKINHVLKNPESEKKYKSFYECKTDIDVMFFGSSHILTAVYPMQLWKDFGITSYNFGNTSSRIKNSYETMMIATSYKKPKICILDVYFANYTDDKDISKDYFHRMFDDFPFSIKKIRTVHKVCPNKSDFFEYLIPFSVYHSRWNEKSIEWKNLFFEIETNKEMGGDTRVLLSPQKEFKPIPKDEFLGKETINLEYIRKFVEYCRENQMTPILINVPWPANEEDQKGANSVYKIAEEMNVEYINFMYEDFFDFDTDCCENSDINSHLNPSGAKKITSYIGKVLTEELNIENHTTDKKYAEWNKYHKEYKKYLISRIYVEYSFKHILLFLTSNCFRGELSVQEDFKFDMVEEKFLSLLSDRLTVKRNLTKDKNIKLSIKIYDTETGEFITEKPSRDGSTF